MRVLCGTVNWSRSGRGSRVGLQKYSVYGVLCNQDGSKVTDEEEGVLVTFSSPVVNANSSVAPPFDPIKPGQLLLIDQNWGVSAAPPNGCMFPTKYSLAADTAAYNLAPLPDNTTETADDDTTEAAAAGSTEAAGTQLIRKIKASAHPDIDFSDLMQEARFPVFAAMIVGVIPPGPTKANGKAPPTNLKLKTLPSMTPLTMAMWSSIAGRALTTYMSSLVGNVIVVEHAACSKQNPLYDFSITAGLETRIWLGSTFLPDDAIGELDPSNLETLWDPLPVLNGISDINSQWRDLHRGNGEILAGEDAAGEDIEEEKNQVRNRLVCCVLWFESLLPLC